MSVISARVKRLSTVDMCSTGTTMVVRPTLSIWRFSGMTASPT